MVKVKNQVEMQVRVARGGSVQPMFFCVINKNHQGFIYSTIHELAIIKVQWPNISFKPRQIVSLTFMFPIKVLLLSNSISHVRKLTIIEKLFSYIFWMWPIILSSVLFIVSPRPINISTCKKKLSHIWVCSWLSKELWGKEKRRQVGGAAWRILCQANQPQYPRRVSDTFFTVSCLTLNHIHTSRYIIKSL